MVASGDIVCGTANVTMGYLCQQAATANLVRAINPSLVLPLGENQYESASLSDFNAFYHATWGQFKAISRPVPGNHEYGTSGGAGNFTYFGSQSTPQEPTCRANCKGYYSYNIGNWHLIALNSQCLKVPGGCAAGSPQETWLKQDLAAVPASKCVLAYWHEPRWSSGHDGNTSIALRSSAFWHALFAAKTDIVLSGIAMTMNALPK